MCGEFMIGQCDVCGKEKVALKRQYYFYGVKCDCHSPEHFEIVEHCNDCTPVPPKRTTITLEPNEIRHRFELEIGFKNLTEEQKNEMLFLFNSKNIQFVIK
jgi:hypothetical protein